MANTMLDLRRADQRTNVLENPVWISSGLITPAADDKEAVLFSFPINSKFHFFCLQEICVETIEAFVGGTPATTIGTGSLATNDITTGGTCTVVDADEYFVNIAASGMGGTTLVFANTGGDFLTAKAAGLSGTSMITCADATVPCIYCALTSSAAITAGSARVHILGSYVPTA